MWLATEPDGTMTYTFIDSLRFSHPWQLVRFVGGALYLTGFVLMLINIRKTRLARDKELMIERILANA
jgi:cytochrome c oxidase cbb3-type subunit 1